MVGVENLGFVFVARVTMPVAWLAPPACLINAPQVPAFAELYLSLEKSVDGLSAFDRRPIRDEHEVRTVGGHSGLEVAPLAGKGRPPHGIPTLHRTQS